jgi:DNA-binding transcriptional MerR regulator
LDASSLASKSLLQPHVLGLGFFQDGNIRVGVFPQTQEILISGPRRYPSDALDRVLLIRFAGEMGFSLGEIKLFLHGLRENIPVGPRWKKLAHRKIKEVEENIQRSLLLKSLLENPLHCRCASLQMCVQRLSPRLRFVAQRKK